MVRGHTGVRMVGDTGKLVSSLQDVFGWADYESMMARLRLLLRGTDGLLISKVMFAPMDRTVSRCIHYGDGDTIAEVSDEAIKLLVANGYATPITPRITVKGEGHAFRGGVREHVDSYNITDKMARELNEIMIARELKAL